MLGAVKRILTSWKKPRKIQKEIGIQRLCFEVEYASFGRRKKKKRNSNSTKY
jgi:hypothetical protein